MEGRRVRRIGALLFALLTIWIFLSMNVFSAFAEDGGEFTGGSSSVVNFDKTDIHDDLNGVADESDFPYNPLGKPQVISFNEYCYSNNTTIKSYYGLYLYVYNPTGRGIYTNGNVLNMGVSYKTDGTVANYGNVDLTPLQTAWENRVIKFKVSESKSMRAMAENYAAAHDGARRYDVVGVQLRWTDGSDAQMDYTYGKTYVFTGFAEGCGETTASPSTLSATVNTLETLTLDVKHTTYRTLDYNEEYICDELNTAYFYVPTETLQKYGEKLQRISAEWFEYKTNPVFVTSDLDGYNALKSMEGVDLSGFEHSSNPDFKWRVLWEENYMPAGMTSGLYTFDKAYNPRANNKALYNNFSWANAEATPRLDWLFYREEPKKDEDFKVTSTEVEEYMAAYTARHPEQGVVDTRGKGSYATGLFAESIDEDRLYLLKDQSKKSGYISVNVDADAEEDKGEMLFHKDQSFWQKLLGKAPSFKDGEVYNPIVQISKNDLAGITAETFSRNYYISPTDAPDILAEFKRKLDAGYQPVLFRFAQTDYYASNARFDKAGDGTGMSSVDGYVAQATTFLGFDIIDLTFKDAEGKETIIGVVADPLDIIPGFEPAPGMDYDKDEWWEKILQLAAILIVAIIFAPLLPLAIKLIVWCITAPFKFFGWLFGIIFHKRD